MEKEFIRETKRTITLNVTGGKIDSFREIEKTTGTVRVYRGGWVDMPFEITLRPIADFQADTANNLLFSDAEKISSWAEDAVAWAAASGLMTGKENARLDPQGKTTREEFAMVLSRFGG